MQTSHANIVKKSLAALLVLSMTNCTPTVGLEKPTITGCTAFRLIYPSRADTVETKRQVLAHNLTYQEICKDETD